MSDRSIDSSSIWSNFTRHIADICSVLEDRGIEADVSNYTDNSIPSSVSSFSDPDDVEEGQQANINLVITSRTAKILSKVKV